MSRRAVTRNMDQIDKPGSIHDTISKEGSSITSPSLERLGKAHVGGWVESMTGKIEMMAHQCTFDPVKRTGEVPASLNLIPRDMYPQAMKAMKEAFRAKLTVSDSIGVIHGEARIGQRLVPKNVVGLLVVSHIIYIGALLKCGIPAVPKFGGLLQIRDYEPLRFVDLIEYSSSSIDPSEIFLSCRMTSVNKVAKEGNGKILASFLEVPALTWPKVESVIKMLAAGGVSGILKLGRVGEPACEIPVRSSQIGIVLLDGLNLIAASVEVGVDITTHTVGEVIDFGELRSFRRLGAGRGDNRRQVVTEIV
jgi:repressor of nif and glnA expression